MASSVPHLHGPYQLSAYDDSIHSGEVGVYVFVDARKTPRYVGRSDTDLGKRLSQWVGVYERFYVEYHTSSRNAYLRECELYHQYRNTLDNEIHPATPSGTSWRCPVSGCEWA